MASLIDNQGPARLVELMPSATITTAAVGATVAAVTGLGAYRQAQVSLILTDAKAAAGDTLDVYVDASPDGGTTWINAIHYTQIVGNGADSLKFTAVLDPGGAAGEDVIASTADLAVSKVRPTVLFDQLRVRYTLVDGGAHGQSFTFSVVALLKA